MQLGLAVIAIALAVVALWNWRAAQRHLRDAEEYGRQKEYYAAKRNESLSALEKLNEIGRRCESGYYDSDDGDD